MTNIRFEELPNPVHAKTKHDHAAIVAALRARPGEWAIVMTYEKVTTASVMAHSIKSARNVAYAPAGTFEAATRKIDGEFRVYARYVGKAS